MANGLSPDAVLLKPAEICSICGACHDVTPMEVEGRKLIRPCISCPVSLAKYDPTLKDLPFQQATA